MSDFGECGEVRYRGVRKRKWGKYVAEIRSGKRSRISLGSYFTPHAAARAYDAALLSLRGPSATTFNFPDSIPLDNPLPTANTNPSRPAIRTAAIAAGSAFDIIPVNFECVEQERRAEPSNQIGEAVRHEQHAFDEETSELNNLLRSPENISFEESIQMPLIHPDELNIIQPYDQNELCPHLGIWDASTSQGTPYTPTCQFLLKSD